MNSPGGSRSLSQLEQILDLARWAPSGDNTQPWRFELLGPLHAAVHGFDTREHCVYDIDGHPSQISMGALLETASIAASAHGLRLDVERRSGYPDTQPTFDLRFVPDSGVSPSKLISVIATRSVQRRPFKRRPLTQVEIEELERALPGSHSAVWLSSGRMRFRTALLMFASAKLRLIMPEAYQVHRDVIEWDAQFSVDRVPDRALGVDVLTTKLMRFVMLSWSRVEFFNRYLAGTWAPRIQMDFLPAMGCAAHFVIVARQPATTIDDYVSAGRAVQRFWLAAAHLRLQLQPELTPLIFSRYAEGGQPMSRAPNMLDRARGVRESLARLVGNEVLAGAVFMGRIGEAPQADSRSVRRPLDDLMWDPAAHAGRSTSE